MRYFCFYQKLNRLPLPFQIFGFLYPANICGPGFTYSMGFCYSAQLTSTEKYPGQSCDTASYNTGHRAMALPLV